MNSLFDGCSPLLRLGTSSWSCRDWVGRLYKSAKQPTEFIGEYARKLTTVEVDSTFYAVPRKSTVERWRDKTPEGFLFAAKAPKAITHEKLLEDCDRELEAFLSTMSLLGERLGPLLFQFPYFAKRTGITQEEFLDRLARFMETLPRDGFRFAVEVRNKAWIAAPLLALLRENAATLALIDHPWMHPPGQLFGKAGIVTGSFAYIRWLGDRRGIEEITKTWDKSVVDRQGDLARWVPYIKELLDKQLPVFGYFNNHYSGCALDDLELMDRLLLESG